MGIHVYAPVVIVLVCASLAFLCENRHQAASISSTANTLAEPLVTPMLAYLDSIWKRSFEVIFEMLCLITAVFQHKAGGNVGFLQV